MGGTVSRSLAGRSSSSSLRSRCRPTPASSSPPNGTSSAWVTLQRTSASTHLDRAFELKRRTGSANPAPTSRPCVSPHSAQRTALLSRGYRTLAASAWSSSRSCEGGSVTVVPSKLRPASTTDGANRFEPYASFRFPIEDFDYTGEEWIAEGTESGGSYTTTVLVRLPRDRSRFSGTVIVEPLHFSRIAPISLYSSPYVMRPGHAWVMVAAQRSTLDDHVKPFDPERYGGLHIDGPGVTAAQPDPSSRSGQRSFWDDMERRNRASSEILAQVGAAIVDGARPFDDFAVRHAILNGH